MPTAAQVASLYRISYQLTYIMLQAIYFICVDHRTRNVYILAGYDEEIEFQILPIKAGKMPTPQDIEKIIICKLVDIMSNWAVKLK